MAGSSVIGALRVDLGLNSAQFTAGLKEAQTGLARFGDAAKVGLGLVAAAAAAATVAFGAAVKGAVDHADALNKSAQKAGVTVEALSRLEYAAKLSDVSLEGLTGGLGKLSKAMAEATANKTSTAATAFRALGVSVTDASGRLRSSTAVLADVADKFARLPDSATKTALAMQMFGKSGAELIPLLNGGSAAMKRLADESDRTGNTISTKTAQAAEQFNDTLTRIGGIMNGVINRIVGSDGFMSALQSLADVLASPEFANAAQTFAENTIKALSEIAKWTADVKVHWNEMVQTIHYGVLKDIINKPEVSSNIEDRTDGTSGTGRLNGAAGELLLNSTFGQLGGATTFSSTKKMFASMRGPELPKFDTTAAVKSLKPLQTAITDTRTDIDLMNEAIGDQAAGAFTSFADAVMSGVAPMKALTDTIGDLSKKLVNKGIEMLFNGLFSSTLSGGAFMPSGGFIPGLTGPKLFASGGISSSPSIFGDAGPEAAVPLPDGRSIPVTLSGGGSGITINNYGARVEQRQGPSGPELDIFVDQSVARNLSRPGTRASRTMRTVYGNSQQLTRR